jgi:LmbE family N-acetylglucosaminyl deacetylase
MFRIHLDHLKPPIKRLLCLGAHCDDIEIGCGGTLIKLLDSGTPLFVTWVVFSSDDEREREALESAHTILQRARTKEIVIRRFRDGFLPFCAAEIKEYIEELKRTISPDLILTHYRNDLHQDHRLISDLTWNTFRNHLILEYEIPKYDGDLGSPNIFVPLSESLCHRKIQILREAFASQHHRPWFDGDLFLSLLRLRGMECNAPEKHAEAFYCRKMVLNIDGGNEER